MTSSALMPIANQAPAMSVRGVCRRNWRPIALIGGLSVVSRVVYGLLGLRFDVSTFPSYLQFIDRELLSTRLFESLWYSHAHPPGLSFFTGVGIKLFGDQADMFYATVFHLLGLVLALSVFALVLRMAGSRIAAYVAAALLVVSPTFVLYENWLMYTFPAATLVAASALALGFYLDTRRIRYAVLFFSLLAVLALTRSVFHFFWCLGVLALLLAVVRVDRRRLLLASVVPLLVVGLWYGKNYFYYGTFSASSLLGLGLSNITTLTLTREELRPLVERGELSPLALVSRYSETETLVHALPVEPTGIPVLDTARKTDGYYNYDYLGLIEVNRIYTRDALTVARVFPFNYVVGILLANRLFFSPTDMNEYFSEANRAATAPMRKLFNPLFYGARQTPLYMVQPHFGFSGAPSLQVNTGFGLIFAWILFIPYAYVKARQLFVNGGPIERNTGIVIGFVLLSILYVYGVSTTLELGENYRYKFLIEPVFLALAASAIADAAGGLRRLLRRAILRH